LSVVLVADRHTLAVQLRCFYDQVPAQDAADPWCVVLFGE
jgi:hypothetical protein